MDKKDFKYDVITTKELAYAVCNYVDVKNETAFDVIRVAIAIIRLRFLAEKEKTDSETVTLKIEGMEGLCVGREKDFFSDAIAHVSREAEEKMKELIKLKLFYDSL